LALGSRVSKGEGEDEGESDEGEVGKGEVERESEEV
jgi:hypothetical protein